MCAPTRKYSETIQLYYILFRIQNLIAFASTAIPIQPCIETCQEVQEVANKAPKRKQPNSPKSKGKRNQSKQQKPNTPNKNKNKKSPKKKKGPPKKKIVEYELTLEQEAKYIAMDCEFVGIGPYGHKSALARVSLVDYNNAIILDTYVQVDEPITDYRTFVSGIESHHLNEGAMESKQCIELVKRLLQGKILVGHGLKNDLGVMNIQHPWYDTRDTAKYEPFMKKAKKNAPPTSMPNPRKLKDLALTKLDRVIQKEGEPHCSIEDAIAALDLYKKARCKWEAAMSYKINRTQQIVEASV